MNLIERLEILFSENFKSSLPGEEAQSKMSPPQRFDLLKNEIDYVEAAVSIFIYKKRNEYYFPLIKRTIGNNNDKHSGQISLPGGKFDKTDSDLRQCALRELQEELGIYQGQVKSVGELSELLIPVSNFRVYPFIFYSEISPVFNPQVSEVQYVLEINLHDLLDPANIKIGEIILESGLRLDKIPYFNLNSHKIWGATAMILNEFRNVCLDLKTK